MPSPFPGTGGPVSDPATLSEAMMLLDAEYADVASGLTPVDSMIGTPVVPAMCSTYTATALANLNTYSNDVSQKLTECDWLDMLIAEECSADSGTLDSITTNSLGSMSFLANKN